MWIYYYATYGPGHQGSDYGFKHFHDTYQAEDIRDYLHHMLSDYNSVILSFWGVERPSAHYVEEKIKDTKERIKNLKESLKMLEAESCFVPDEKEGEDIVLMRNLRKIVDKDLLRRLHKVGFMYDANDIDEWYHGKKYPIEPNRSKILQIIRRTEKYPS